MSEYPMPANDEDQKHNAWASDELYVDQPALEVPYDPKSIALVTERQIAEIEKQLSLPLEPGETDQDLDRYVHRALRQIGVNPNLAREGVVMINRVDAEGSSTLSALVIDPSDFGTEKLHVTPVEVALGDERQDQSNADYETPSEPESEDTWEQIQAREKLVEVVTDLTMQYDRALEESNQHGQGRDEAIADFLKAAREKLTVIFPQTEGAPRIDQSAVARLLSEWSNICMKAVNAERGDAEYDVVRSRHYRVGIDEAATDAKGSISSTAQTKLEPKLRDTLLGADALTDNRTYNRSTVDQLRSNVTQIISTLEEVQYSTTGDEQLRGRLLGLLGEADGLYEQHSQYKTRMLELLVELNEVVVSLE